MLSDSRRVALGGWGTSFEHPAIGGMEQHSTWSAFEAPAVIVDTVMVESAERDEVVGVVRSTVLAVDDVVDVDAGSLCASWELAVAVAVQDEPSEPPANEASPRRHSDCLAAVHHHIDVGIAEYAECLGGADAERMATAMAVTLDLAHVVAIGMKYHEVPLRAVSIEAGAASMANCIFGHGNGSVGAPTGEGVGWLWVGQEGLDGAEKRGGGFGR